MGVIRGRCPFCAKGYKTTAENLGKTGRCRKCGQPFEVEAGDLDASEGSLEFSAEPEPGIEGECPVCQAGYFAQAKDLGKAAQCGSCRANITVAPARTKRKASLAEQWKSRRAEMAELAELAREEMEEKTLENTVMTEEPTDGPKAGEAYRPSGRSPTPSQKLRPQPAPFLMRPLNHPGVAAVLSFFVPGLGFLYCGRFPKATTWILIFCVVVAFGCFFVGYLYLMLSRIILDSLTLMISMVAVLSMPGLGVAVAHTYQIMDSYRAAEAENRRILAAHGYAQR